MKKAIKRLLSIQLIMTMLMAMIPVISNANMSISIGEYVEMGTYYGQPILWRCVDIDEVGPLMMSDKILCLKAFDAETSDNSTTGSHSRGRETFESNYWGDSNMRSWLNSSAGAGNVVWLCGNPPAKDGLWNGYNAYDKEAGFLSNFTQSEIDAMREVSQKFLLSKSEYDNGMATTGSEPHNYDDDIANAVQNYDTAYAEYITDKMFLPDVKQIYEVYQNSDILGDNYYIGEPTAECVENSEYKNSWIAADEKWYSWLRTPNYDGCSHIRYIYSSGGVYNTSAYYGNVGVRPAFYLNLSVSIKSGNGTESNPYIIVGGSTAEDKCQIADIIIDKEISEVNITTDKDIKGTLILACYDSKGKLTAIKKCEVDLYANISNSELVEIDTAGAVKMKAFLWQDIDDLIPICPILEKNIEQS